MEELLEILEDLHPEIDFETTENLITDGILDSLDIVTLVSEISENFDIAVSAKYITPANFNSAQAIYQMIETIQAEG